MADSNVPDLTPVADIAATDELYLVTSTGTLDSAVPGTAVRDALETGGGIALVDLAAGVITSGALVHERGGLEADVNAYDGLVKISGGATSAVALPLTHENGGLEADVSAYAGLVKIAAGATSAVTNLAGLNTALGTNLLDSGQYREVWIDAAAMVPRDTNGAEAATEEYATNDIMVDHYLFDGATEEGVQFKLALPDTWNIGTVKVKVYWDAATSASASDTVEWGVAGGSYANDDPIDAALGTPATINDVVIAVGDLHISPASSAITIANTPALGDMLIFEVTRQVAGTDDMTEDAKLLGVSIQYQELTTAAAAW